MELLLFDREDDARPARVIPIDPGSQSDLSLLARVRTRRLGRARSMDFECTGHSIPRAASALIRPKSSSILMAAPSWFRRTTAAISRTRRGDNAATAMKSVVVDPHAYDWEGDAPLNRPSLAHDHLRNARARLHRTSQFRRCRERNAARTPA